MNIDSSHKLFLYENNLNKSIRPTSNKLVIIGAVGKMRIGKSSALNNFFCIMTGKSTRPFSEKASTVTETRGIHIIHVPNGEMTNEFKNFLHQKFNETVDVILLDCEGTESSDNVGTSKLYLMNMLINSVIHIHVKDAIDKNFADKFSQAVVSCHQLIEVFGKKTKDFLPGVKILIKDTDDEAWENSKQSDTNLRTYEDLLRPYKGLYDYYTQFPQREVRIITAPDTLGGKRNVTKKDSFYWKDLEKVFRDSFSVGKLKSREELLLFMKQVLTAINTNNLMNVSSEIESFYKSMFLTAKNNLLSNIVKSCLSDLDKLVKFSPEELEEQIMSYVTREYNLFRERVKNIACKHIYENLHKELEKSVNTILKNLEQVLESAKNKYSLERERTKKVEEKWEEQVKTRDETIVKQFHSEFKYMCQFCGDDPSSQGCFMICESRSTGFWEKAFDFVINLTKKVFSLGMWTDNGTYDKIIYKHKGPNGNFCVNCRKTADAKECLFEKSIVPKEYLENVYIGSETNYQLEEWNNVKAKKDYFNCLTKFLENLSIDL